jgi:peptide/nickel transport system ATP-binding protein
MLQTERKVAKPSWNEIAMIFQEPMSSLNPSLKCGFQVQEILLQHTKLSSQKQRQKHFYYLKKSKTARPSNTIRKVSHEISGGQTTCQDCHGYCCKPLLLIADEPTTALDVTVQKEIIQLLEEIQQETE